MTKSKIFLGGSAFLLAIAGAFASKASNKTAVLNGYYASANHATCDILTISCTGGQNLCTHATALGGNAQVYRTLITCQTAATRN